MVIIDTLKKCTLMRFSIQITHLSGSGWLFLILLIFSSVKMKAQIYVDADATAGSDNGTSWSDAYTQLQSAISAANSGDEIWVAEGTYFPTLMNPASSTSSVRDVTFYINKDNVKLYGGFTGTETMRSQRDFGLNLTILNGNIGNTSTFQDNAYHVLFIDGTSIHGSITQATTIDGFHIQNGYADGSGKNEDGGGIYNSGGNLGRECSPTILNCTFENNYAENEGGAMLNDGENEGQSNPLIKNCVFDSNYVNDDGGAISNNGEEGISNATIDECTFTNNYASAYGGAINNDGNDGQSNLTLQKSTFTCNWGDKEGGAIYNNGYLGQANATIKDCTFSKNYSSSFGGAIIGYGEDGQATLDVTSCTFSSNTSNEGGAIHFFASDEAAPSTIKSCVFDSNLVSSAGGAIYIYGNELNIDVDIINCLFSNNNGDHITYFDGDSGTPADIINCTFVGASVHAIAFDNFGYSQNPLLAKNCIFWDNTLIVCGDNIDDNDGNEFNNIIIEQSIIGDDPGGNYTGSGNIYQDPLFMDTVNNNFTLQHCSPAIDQGDNLAIDTVSQDLAGNPRIAEGTVDIGSYEFPGFPNLFEVTEVIESDDLIEKFDTIQTNGTVEVMDNDTLTFEATKLVILRPGFHASVGSQFTARILDCSFSGLSAPKAPIADYGAPAIPYPSLQFDTANPILPRQNLQVVLFPNPFYETTTIEVFIPDSQDIQFIVSDLNGNIIKTESFDEAPKGWIQTTFDAGNLPNGIYLLAVKTNRETIMKKMVINRN